MVISKKTIIFQGFRGGRFSGGGGGGGGGMSRGVQMLISIEAHITCDFLGGGGGPNANFYRSPYNL